MTSHLRIFFSNPKAVAIGVGFFLLGFLFGNWATMIPFVKENFQISDSILGVVLLCLPLGAMSFNPIAALLIQKYGMQTMTVFGMINLSIAYSIPLLFDSLFFVPIGLIFIGVSMTTLNIAVNTMATSLEQSERINIMSTCHGLFSIGLMIGSLMRSITLLFSIEERWHMVTMGLLAICLTLLVMKLILSVQSNPTNSTIEEEKFKFTLPSGILLTLIFISICINVTEGSMADWTTLYMRETVKTSPYFEGWGLVGYSSCMALGRLFGDGIIPKYGKNNVLSIGGLVACFGFLIVILLPYTITSIFGFAMIGLGVSCGAPILYGSAARYPDIPGGGGLALMNTYAMGGFTLGPVIIGFISDITSLAIAFSFVGILCIFWFTYARKVTLY